MPRIVIGEDNADTREMLQFDLREANFEVLEPENALTATDCLKHQRVALILMDWLLADMSGLEIARRIKRNPSTRDIPI